MGEVSGTRWSPVDGPEVPLQYGVSPLQGPSKANGAVARKSEANTTETSGSDVPLRWSGHRAASRLNPHTTTACYLKAKLFPETFGAGQ